MGRHAADGDLKGSPMANTVDRGYRPISDYAIIGDAHMSALVARDGSIDWCCWPHFDSPAVFCRLLDARRGGWFRVAPTKPCEIWREYLDRTNVLSTTFTAASGRIRLVDFMPARARNGRRGEDIEESHAILRLVEGLGGDVHVMIQFKPTFDYARAAAAIELGDGVAIAKGENCALRLTAPVRLSVRADGTVVGALRVRNGERWWIALTDEDDRRVDDPQHILDATLQYWREWDRRCSYHGPYEEHVRRSALVLKLLTFEPTGAVIAAPTTSLPEGIGGVRNWDYRFTWLRERVSDALFAHAYRAPR